MGGAVPGLRHVELDARGGRRPHLGRQRRRRRQRRLGVPGPAASHRSAGHRHADLRGRRGRLAAHAHAASPSSTGSSAGGWSRARSPSSAASRGSASPPCSSRPWRPWPAPPTAACWSRPRSRPSRSACGPSGSGALHPRLWLLSETELPAILTALDEVAPAVVVIDSIQTVFDPDLSSAPGTVTQVRECAHRLVRVAKERDLAVVLVGHVTKDGGPGRAPGARARGRHRPVLRGRAPPRPAPAAGHQAPVRVDQRAGPVRDDGHRPGGRARRRRPVPGRPPPGHSRARSSSPPSTASGPLLVELQALVAATPTTIPNPRRSAQGVDGGRLALLLAVLDRELHLKPGHHRRLRPGRGRGPGGGAGGRPRPGPGRGLVGLQPAPARRPGGVRRDRPRRRAAPGGPDAPAAGGGGPPRLHHRGRARVGARPAGPACGPSGPPPSPKPWVGWA